MGETPDLQLMLASTHRMRLALAQIQLAVLDLHEAFAHRDAEQAERINAEAAALLAKMRRK